MIGMLGLTAVPEETRARAAQSAVPHEVPNMEFRCVGQALIGIATRPDFVQEWLSAPGDLVAAITGRLDNANELASELRLAGRVPTSEASADVVVAAFRHWGPMCVNRFRGAVSGVVTDGETMHAFRDHVGFRPMFFRRDASAVVFAGEARPVAIAAGIPVEPNMEVLEDMLFYGMPSHNPAALNGVYRQPQGTVMSAGVSGTFETNRYWIPWKLLETAKISLRDAEVRLRELLDQAVRRSMDGPTLVMLSGGLDSPAVAAYLAPEHQRRFGSPAGALTAEFPEYPEIDESELVRITAGRFGMQLHTMRPSAKTLDDVEWWSRAFASPTPMLSIPEMWDMYRQARAIGYRTVLTGEFAELTYGKWPHSLGHALMRGRFGPFRDVWAAERARGRGRRNLLADVLFTFAPGRLTNWWLGRDRVAPTRRFPRWMRNDRADAQPLARPDLETPSRLRWSILQMAGTEGSTITMEADALCATMAGVHLRRPFADIDLWEFFLSLPAHVKFPTLEWKSLARRALRGVVPDEILDRGKKVVFNSHVLSQVDYPTLRRLLVAPKVRLAGIDYDLLADDLAHERLDFPAWLRARDLAKIHAFLLEFP